MTKRQQRETTRKRILETGVKLFANKGYVSTSMQDIARALKMTTGVLYWHFRSKEDILAAVLQTTFEELTRPGEGTVPGDPAVTFRTMIARVGRIASANLDGFRMIGVISAEAVGTNPRIETILRNAYRLLEDPVSQMLARGNGSGAGHSPEISDTKCAAQVFMAFYMGAFMHQRLFGRAMPLDRMLPVAERMLFGSVFPHAIGAPPRARKKAARARVHRQG